MPTDTTASARARASDELREVALEHFATVGFGASSLQQIADHAGYSKSSVLYHFASKEALLEAAIGPSIDALEDLLGDLIEFRRSPGERGAFIDRFVDFLLANRLAVHTFVNQGQSLRGIPVIERANVAINRLAEAVCADEATAAEQVRFGFALGGAAFILATGNLYRGDAPELPEDEVRTALVAVLSELLLPARAGRPDRAY